jgi:dihydrofolate reductase
MKVSIIVAFDKNRLIGKENRLPWRLPADMKRFKTLTMGHFMIMGRKTFESVEAPLPGRTSIVVTRQLNYKVPEGVHVVNSVEEGIKLAEKEGEQEVFVIGGEEIFKLALEQKLANFMYLTEIQEGFEGDAWFPEFDKTQWKITELQHFEPDEKNKYPYDFINWEKV